MFFSLLSLSANKKSSVHLNGKTLAISLNGWPTAAASTTSTEYYYFVNIIDSVGAHNGGDGV